MQFAVIPNLLAEIAIPESGRISRVLHDDPALKVLIFGFAAGHEFASHSAAVPVTLLFLEGEALLTLGEQRQEVGPGAWVHMEAKLVHSVTAKTPVRMLLQMHKSAISA
jgi:quercetin dioxygenase-like cupin family protein